MNVLSALSSHRFRVVSFVLTPPAVLLLQYEYTSPPCLPSPPPQGETLSFNYCTTEWDMASPFTDSTAAVTKSPGWPFFLFSFNLFFSYCSFNLSIDLTFIAIDHRVGFFIFRLLASQLFIDASLHFYPFFFSYPQTVSCGHVKCGASSICRRTPS